MSVQSQELGKRGALSNGLLRALGKTWLRLTGWRVDPNLPAIPNT